MSNGFPTGEFYIRNAATGLFLDVSGSATVPGSPVIVWTRNNPQTDNQIWRYETGFLISVDTGFVLEVPGHEEGGRITPGTGLVISPRRELPDSINQLWAYNNQTLMPYDPSVRVTGGNTGSRAVVTSVTSDNFGQAFQWSFVPA